MSAPRVSVLFPCRDAELYLAEAIHSLDAQTYTDFEVIAVDDGSTDATPDLLAAWARRSHRVRVGHSAGEGLVAALQTASAVARGELLARMDADDVAEPLRLERQVALLDARRDVAACGTQVRYFPRELVRDGARRYEDWINALLEPAEIARDIFVECPLPHPTLLVRREAFVAVGGYRDPDGPEDYDLALRLWSGGFLMAKVPEPLLHWREREDRLSRVDARYAPEAFRRLKVEALRQTLLVGRAGVVVWGAGPIGKAFARELTARDVSLRAFVELDRRKIGQTIYGAPVIPPAGVERYRAAFVLAAVGSPGAREEIRVELAGRGFREMLDFCAVA